MQKLLGNAVPSLLAEVLARAIRMQLLDNPAEDSQPQLLPPVRAAVPPPEPVTALPGKYRRYIGDHDDHPGESLGAGARRRDKAQKKDTKGVYARA